LRARVNGDLPLEFADVALTSYAGLELLGRYLRTIALNPVAAPDPENPGPVCSRHTLAPLSERIIGRRS
jgi:hypothetical protein